ncbi:hypothetical protein WME75_15875 [Sorangium sp. So ce1014]|uniref:hypothetical protein n=1 Tax=Sorangium sp. So ce1014 TaxID=3133326 RepID=UPI003F5EC08F
MAQKQTALRGPARPFPHPATVAQARPAFGRAANDAPGARGDAAEPAVAQPIGLAIGGLAVAAGASYLLYRWFTGSRWVQGVRTQRLGVAVPGALANAMAGATAAEIRQNLVGLTTVRLPAYIDGLSAYNGQFNGANYLRTNNWASGGAADPLTGLRTLDDVAVRAFFIAVFEKVRVMTASRFSRADLFHGHINLWNGDVIIVFHAKEYPSDLEPNKSQFAAQVEGIPAFNRHDPAFRFRNAVYSFNRNAVDSLDTPNVGAHPVYGALIRDGYTLAEEQMGTPVAGINYFPGESPDLLFLK